MTDVLLALLIFAAPSARTNDFDDDAPTKKALPPDPSGKLYERFEPTRGFFLGADVGFMWMFGDAERGYSNTQVYAGVNLGYDFTKWFSWQLHVGRGFVGSAPRTANQVDRIRDFSFTNFMTGPVVWIMVWERLAIEVKALGGISLFDTPVLEDVDANGNQVDGVAGARIAGAAGGGLGLKYLTLLTDFTIGLEVTFTYIIYPEAPMPVLNLTPLAVRYTF